MRILHISDLHFQGDCPLSRWPALGWRRVVAQTEFRLLGRRRLFLRVRETVARLLAEADRLEVDHLLVSGDLTALSLPEEFEAAREALMPWRGRMTIVPGNHDRYTPEASRARLFEQAFEQALVSDMPEHRREGVFPVVKLIGEDAAVIGLCSARVPPMPGIAAGWLGRSQLAGLSAALGDPRLAGRAILAAVHHAPFRPNGQRDMPQHGLWDGPELLALLAGAKATALCHGHIHRRYRLPGPGAVSIFCAGSSTQAGMEGYWVLDVAAGGLRSAEAVRLAA
ncbi:MAG: metallophosphoesterase family protein [Deltaproteobacteria bacterium]